jgi:DNA helicase MCM9
MSVWGPSPEHIYSLATDYFLRPSSRPLVHSLLLPPPSTLSRDYSFLVDVSDLYAHSSLLANFLSRYPDKAITVLETSMVRAQEALKSQGGRGTVKGDMYIKGELNWDRIHSKNSHSANTSNSITLTRLHARLTHLPPFAKTFKQRLDDITSSDMNQLVQLGGTVTKTSAVRMMQRANLLRCKNKACNNNMWEHLCNLSDEANQMDMSHAKCHLCGLPNYDVFKVDYCDYQEVKIQESASKLAVGSIPRTLTVLLMYDLVNKCNPGDEIIVVGTLLGRWSNTTENLRPDIKMCLNANSLEVRNGNESVALLDVDMEQHNNLVKSFEEYWEHARRGKHLYASRNLIVKSVCPKLYGMMTVKLGLLLTLIGGVGEDEPTAGAGDNNNNNNNNNDDDDDDDDSKEKTGDGNDDDHAVNDVAAPAAQSQDGSFSSSSQLPSSANSQSSSAFEASSRSTLRRRSQCHCLMVGDPGTGKSQLLRFANAISPRSVMTTGVGTTSAGLTCSAVRDGTGWSLEAGALVLADRGVCCIDEFGCISKKDLTSIHEAMEQQSLSVAKAGMICKLNSRATVIATTNPKGSYDASNTLKGNTGIDDPLLSRFDLIFLMLDMGSVERDGNIVDHILNMNIRGDNHEPAAGKKSKGEESGLHSNIRLLSGPSLGPAGPSQAAGFGGVSSTLPDMTKTWKLGELRSYIAAIKDRLKPVLSREATRILTAHYSHCRKKNEMHNPVTVRLLESLIRLAQAHARLMYRSVVTVDDACAAVMVMECTHNVAGGVFSSRENNDLWQDPMDCEFPLAEMADDMFEEMKMRVLRRYGMDGGSGGGGGGGDGGVRDGDGCGSQDSGRHAYNNIGGCNNYFNHSQGTALTSNIFASQDNTEAVALMRSTQRDTTQTWGTPELGDGVNEDYDAMDDDAENEGQGLASYDLNSRGLGTEESSRKAKKKKKKSKEKKSKKRRKEDAEEEASAEEQVVVNGGGGGDVYNDDDVWN